MFWKFVNHAITSSNITCLPLKQAPVKGIRNCYNPASVTNNNEESRNKISKEDDCLTEKAEKKCVDCSTSQQIKCFGIDVVSRGISKNRKCTKTCKE
jgi:hypothetical protein